MSLPINDPWKLLYEPLVIQESVYLQFYATLTLPTIVHLQQL